MQLISNFLRKITYNFQKFNHTFYVSVVPNCPDNGNDTFWCI